MDFEVARRNVQEAKPTWEAISFAVWRKGNLRKMLELWNAPPAAFEVIASSKTGDMDDLYDLVLTACKTRDWSDLEAHGKRPR